MRQKSSEGRDEGGKRESEMTTDESTGREKERLKTTVLREIKACTERLPQHMERKLLLWWGKQKREEKLKMGREKRGGNQKEKDSLRQAGHSREVEEGTQRSSEANREEFQTERVCVCLCEYVCNCEFVCAARWSVCPDNSIYCPLTGLPLRLHS